MISINKISQTDFYKSNNVTLFEDVSFNRCYGELILDNVGFKLGWNSDLLIPKIICLSMNVYAIGIDMNVAIIDFNNKKIIKSFILDYNFCEFILFQEKLYVISELEIFKIKNEDYSINETFLLNDIYSSFSIKKNIIYIESLDGTVLTIS